MVRPMTNWRPRMRIAAVTAWRTTGSPDRSDQALQRRPQIARAGVGAQQAPGQHQRPGRGVDEDRVGMAEMALPNRPRRACRGSAGRRSRRRECAAAPRRGTAMPRLPARTARIRAGRRRCRPCRGARGAPPRPAGAPFRRSGRAPRRDVGCSQDLARLPQSRRAGHGRGLPRAAARPAMAERRRRDPWRGLSRAPRHCHPRRRIPRCRRVAKPNVVRRQCPRQILRQASKRRISTQGGLVRISLKSRIQLLVSSLDPTPRLRNCSS